MCLNTQEEYWTVESEDWAPDGAQRDITLLHMVQLLHRSPCGSSKDSNEFGVAL